MRIFAPDSVTAKSRFWYFIRQLKKMKKGSGEIVSCKRVSYQGAVLIPFVLMRPSFAAIRVISACAVGQKLSATRRRMHNLLVPCAVTGIVTLVDELVIRGLHAH